MTEAEKYLLRGRDHWAIKPTRPCKTKVGRFFKQLHLGAVNLYPPCCIVRFSWDSLFGRKSGQLRGGIHRRWPDGAPRVWVPCGLFHRPDPGWEPNRG